LQSPAAQTVQDQHQQAAAAPAILRAFGAYEGSYNTYICLLKLILLVDLEQREAGRSLEKQQHVAAAVLVLFDVDMSKRCCKTFSEAAGAPMDCGKLGGRLQQ
jgi:hypothetical protein